LDFEGFPRVRVKEDRGRGIEKRRTRGQPNRRSSDGVGGEKKSQGGKRTSTWGGRSARVVKTSLGNVKVDPSWERKWEGRRALRMGGLRTVRTPSVTLGRFKRCKGQGGDREDREKKILNAKLLQDLVEENKLRSIKTSAPKEESETKKQKNASGY